MAWQPINAFYLPGYAGVIAQLSLQTVNAVLCSERRRFLKNYGVALFPGWPDHEAVGRIRLGR